MDGLDNTGALLPVRDTNNLLLLRGALGKSTKVAFTTSENPNSRLVQCGIHLKDLQLLTYPTSFTALRHTL